jgi:phosphatidylinositol alpha-1,6-mannosyltransferase
LLFIARAYPPTLGGMENFACNLLTHLRERRDLEVTELINHHGKKALPAFLPLAAVRGIAVARRGRLDAIHLADALLAPVGATLKRMTGLPVTASVCGLDITYANRLYQAAVPRALRSLDMVMPISRATEDAMRARTGFGIRSRVVPLGINPLPRADEEAAREFRASINVGPDTQIVLTVGRLIERKGAAWFVRDVLPRLDASTIYVVVGEGPEREQIADAARAAGVAGRVRMVGRIDNGELSSAYAAADLFVMPNVPVAGDLEGFGLVALEAAAAGVPVVGSDLEGIQQAIRHERNGLLAPPLDAEAWTASIQSLLSLPRAERQALGARFGAAALADFGWDRTAARYAELITALVQPERELAAAA